MKRRLALAVICAVAAGIAASAANAADVNVNPFSCQTFHGGSVTVPAGSSITIRQGVSEQTLGILMDYLNAQTTTISVDGTSVDVSDAWSDPVGFGPHLGWLSVISYPTGVTLAAPGDALTVSWTTTLAHAVPEVFNPSAGGPAGQPAFNAASVTYTCTVTAA